MSVDKLISYAPRLRAEIGLILILTLLSLGLAIIIGCTDRRSGSADGRQTDSRERGQPIVYRVVDVPRELTGDAGYAGDVRIGDLTGNGQIEVVVFRSVDNGMKPSFISAFTLEGEVLWQIGSNGSQPARPGPVTVRDLDRDGSAEVICFFVDQSKQADVRSMANVTVQIRGG